MQETNSIGRASVADLRKDIIARFTNKNASIGRALTDQAKFDEAEKYFSLAEEQYLKSPEVGYALNLRGRLNLLLEHQDKARSDFLEAAEQLSIAAGNSHPDTVFARTQLSSINRTLMADL